MRRVQHTTLSLVALLCVVAALVASSRSPSASANSILAGMAARVGPAPSRFALQTIPTNYIHLYIRAADEYGLDWTKLAAVGQIESDAGRSQMGGVSYGTNSAGAAGPAQFLQTTWARYGVNADGRGSSSPYDPADAITAMAAYLKASGAPENWWQALYSYNHSDAYVNDVLALSKRFARAN